MTKNKLTVIIPVRNEEHNIAECLGSLINQSYPDLNIIVVNDNSTDNSAAIIARSTNNIDNIQIINIDDTPPGWTGKNFALYNGFSESDTSIILFLDADVRLSKYCLEKSMKLLEDNSYDLISYAAFQECKSFWEYSIQPLVFYILNILYPFKNINSPSIPDAACNGIFIMIKRDLYEKLGGHSTVKSEILEDVSFAKLAKTNGAKLYFNYHPDLITVRMYRNLYELFTGWSKNFFPLLNYSYTKSLAIIFLLITPFWFAFILLFTAFPFKILLLCWLIFLLCYFCYAYSRMGYSFLTGLLFPAGSILLTSIIVNSIINYRLKGSVSWKDRKYIIK